MPLPVELKQVAAEIGILDEQTYAYINRRTGELATLSDEEIDLAEDEDSRIIPEWQSEIIEQAKTVLSTEDYIQLPGPLDFHEYRVMERFCWSLDDAKLQDKLLAYLRGRGAFRRFKDGIHEAGIEQLWYDYRDQALMDLAAAFLEEEGIPYI